jgi:bifunctional DNase/RNase
LYEGGAIGLVLTGQGFPRPLTHDLFLVLMKTLGADIEKVVIARLQDSTFFAEIHGHQGQTPFVLDARPSDSLALAVRRKCPVYVAENVFQACPELLKPISQEDVDDFRKKLATLKPEDFFRDLKKKKDNPDGGHEG